MTCGYTQDAMHGECRRTQDTLFQLTGFTSIHLETHIHAHVVELSDSENFTITIVEMVIFTIMNAIMILDLLNISIHNTKRFLKYYEPSQF